MDAAFGTGPFLASWTLGPQFVMEESLRELVASQHATFRAFKELRGCLTTADKSVQDATKELEDELHRVDAATKAFLPPRYFNELHGHDALTMPHRALSTAEILETIFLQLDLEDLLVLRKINRKFRDVISETKSLQQATFLSAATDKHFRIPLSDSHHIDMIGALFDVQRPRLQISGKTSIHESGMPMPNQTQVQIQITGELERFNVTSMYRRMLVCQPPVKEIIVQPMSCCGSRRHYLRSYYDKGPVQTPLKAETGITLGDIYDFAAQVAKQHRLCPCASTESLDDQGFVHPKIALSGTVDAESHDQINNCIDPLGLCGTLPPLSTPPDSSNRSKKKKVHLKAYRTAKLLAAHNDVPIPTLKEYDEKRVYYEGLPKPYWLDSMTSRY
jgi:hypothetical protein